MDKVSYSFVKEENNLIFRSKVNSFNLDHVTDKDITSFFTSFSNYAYFDTGLLPVDGTGLLGIRRAGDHTQVIYQYKPGMYYINWGAYERDSDYTKYYLAQPYRIVVIDFLSDNLLGARTFYTVEPAIHSAVQLYHVNLPNINCRGYRGNGVGWICLYHNEDWSTLPFNERLNRALERCSGVEVYNDANMSETDGPRFYQEREMPLYTWSPGKWEQKSTEEGWEWTLDSSNWIPIQVEGRDSQGHHKEGGVPLTLVDAIIGNYSSYYGDTYLPKPINALTRPDLNIESKKVTDWFVKSYNSSKTTFSGLDPYSASSQIREQTSVATPTLFDEDEDENNEDEQDFTICTMTGESVLSDDCSKDENYYSVAAAKCMKICSGCVNNHEMVYAENTMQHYVPDHMGDKLYYDSHNDQWYDTSAIKTPWGICSGCEGLHISPFPDKQLFLVWENQQVDNATSLCSYCIGGEDVADCINCGISIPNHTSQHFDSATIKYDPSTEHYHCAVCVQILESANSDNLTEPDQTQAKNLLQLLSELTGSLIISSDEEPF